MQNIYVRLRHYNEVALFLQTLPAFKELYFINTAVIRTLLAQLLPVLVGPALYLKHANKIHEWSGLADIPQDMTVFITGRQTGKTNSITFAMVCLMCVSNGGGKLVFIYSITLQQVRLRACAARLSRWSRVGRRGRPSW